MHTIIKFAYIENDNPAYIDPFVRRLEGWLVCFEMYPFYLQPVTVSLAVELLCNQSIPSRQRNLVYTDILASHKKPICF